MSFTEEQIAERVFLLCGDDGGGFPRTLSLLVRDERCALIDVGCGAAALGAIAATYHPDLVIITHAHPDHCSGGGLFPSAQLWGPAESIDYAGDLGRMSERFVAPSLRQEWIAFMRARVGFVEFGAGNAYRHGHRWELGQSVIEAVHAPGHTQDHYCMSLPREQLLLSTDIDLTGFGPWYGNPDSDIDAFIDSIARVRAMPLRALISSHKGFVGEGWRERLDRFASAFEAREARVLAHLARPRTLKDYVDAALIYGRYPYRPGILRSWEGEMVRRHLRRLSARGLVVEEAGAYRRVTG